MNDVPYIVGADSKWCFLESKKPFDFGRLHRMCQSFNNCRSMAETGPSIQIPVDIRQERVTVCQIVNGIQQLEVLKSGLGEPIEPVVACTRIQADQHPGIHKHRDDIAAGIRGDPRFFADLPGDQGLLECQKHFCGPVLCRLSLIISLGCHIQFRT